MFPKYTNDVYMIKCRTILKTYCQNINLGFCKGYIAQHCLIALIEKWKQNVNNGGAFQALMRDLPKAFDCLSHEFFMAKFDDLVLIKSL